MSLPNLFSAVFPALEQRPVHKRYSVALRGINKTRHKFLFFQIYISLYFDIILKYSVLCTEYALILALEICAEAHRTGNKGSVDIGAAAA